MQHQQMTLAKRALTPRPHTPRYVSDSERARQIEIAAFDGKDKFNNLAEFMGAIINAGGKLTEGGTYVSVGSRLPDVRLTPEASVPGVAGSESSGQDGGYLIPPDLVEGVASPLYGRDSLLMKTDVRTTRTGSLYLPVDTSAPWGQNFGVTVKWASELTDESNTPSKLALNGELMRLYKIFAYMPVTNELAADSVALAEHVNVVAGEKILWAIERAIIAGSGVGQPLGIVNSAGTVVVAKDAGQTAGTVTHSNFANCFKAISPIAQKDLLWIIHPDVLPQVQSMTFPNISATAGSGTGGYQPATPDAPWGSVFGKPLWVTEAANAPGTPGDLIAASMSSYLSVVTALRYAASIHLYFLQDIQALRFSMRINGMPISAQTWTSPQGGATRGLFSVVAQR